MAKYFPLGVPPKQIGMKMRVTGGGTLNSSDSPVSRSHNSGRKQTAAKKALVYFIPKIRQCFGHFPPTVENSPRSDQKGPADRLYTSPDCFDHGKTSSSVMGLFFGGKQQTARCWFHLRGIRLGALTSLELVVDKFLL